MELNEYQKLAEVTESKDFDAIRSRINEVEILRLLHAGIGMVTEAGEFVDQLKKHIFYGKPLDRVNLSEEMGDGMWYQALAANAMKLKTLQEIIETNIAKLKARYGDKFTEYMATNRDLLTERNILEKE